MDYINILQLSDNFTENLQLTKNVNNYVDIVEKFRDKGEIMRIVVLAGGTSTERDVSLVTGYRVCESLRRNGHEANMLDIFLGVDDNEAETFFIEKNDLGELSDNLKKKTADIPAEVKRRTEARESFFGRNVLELCKEADMVFVCRKIYTKDMEENDFTDKSLLKFYESDPFHKAFTGEIVSVYQKK